MSTTESISINLTRKDFASDQEVRWCPGCGDYAILAQMQRVLPELGIPKENIVFISGIGCSSRFPYYMDTYGIHTIHGRAPTIATGLAIANPELSIWVITGDGDGLSIGGNHLIHACRRNVNLNIILFNNRIYGLTKGQYSPTSQQGHKTKSSPMGSIEQPLHPLSLALSAEATFVARTIDSQVRHLAEILRKAAAHQGTSFVEVYQNCVIFNGNEWDDLSDRKTRDEHMLFMEEDKPLVFGKNKDKGLILDGFTPAVVELGNGTTEEDLLVHDKRSKDMAHVLSRVEHPTLMGVFREVEKLNYTEALMGQVQQAQAEKGVGDLNQLYRTADLWEVKADEVESSVAGELAAELDEEYVDKIEGDTDNGGEHSDYLATELLQALNPKTPLTVQPDTSLSEAITTMNDHNIGCVLVTNPKQQLVGIFTERDVLTKVACQVEDLDQQPISEYMTTHPYVLKVDMPISHALNLMSNYGFRHLPLVNEAYEPTGIISFRDVVHYLKANLR